MTDPAVEQDRRLQADPELELSAGRANWAQIVAAAVAAAVVVVVTLYGLTHQRDEGPSTASTAAPATTGAAPPATQQDANKQADQGQQSGPANTQGNGQSQGAQGSAQPQGGTPGSAPQGNQADQRQDPNTP